MKSSVFLLFPFLRERLHAVLLLDIDEALVETVHLVLLDCIGIQQGVPVSFE